MPSSQTAWSLRFPAVAAVGASAEGLQEAALREATQDARERGHGYANLLAREPPCGNAFRRVHRVGMLFEVPQDRRGHLIIVWHIVHVER